MWLLHIVAKWLLCLQALHLYSRQAGSATSKGQKYCIPWLVIRKTIILLGSTPGSHHFLVQDNITMPLQHNKIKCCDFLLHFLIFSLHSPRSSQPTLSVPWTPLLPSRLLISALVVPFAELLFSKWLHGSCLHIIQPSEQMLYLTLLKIQSTLSPVPPRLLFCFMFIVVVYFLHSMSWYWKYFIVFVYLLIVYPH